MKEYGKNQQIAIAWYEKEAVEKYEIEFQNYVTFLQRLIDEVNYSNEEEAMLWGDIPFVRSNEENFVIDAGLPESRSIYDASLL